ncbi:hypothetical protein Bhyg_15353 [Pseudolycoriella hygida]|uniref:Uncharacterized protein n=1 Tax=Pseudolycoriella hygida TaxID=35572 RepID=A0A9Q0RYB4_9DIPT|nr:hypothetical protein Bhyg_15353 [Pseudolycoriella hygida]
MAHLFEYRKVNEIYVPLYFKFSTISSKHNLTCDKFMSLENWIQISDELDPLLVNGLDPNSSKKSISFDVDHQRVTVKVRWLKITDSDLGNHILKFLNLTSSSTNVSKYYLKLEFKLNSNFQKIVTELEQKNKCLEEKIKPSHESSRSIRNSTIRKNSNYRKISEMLPKINKDEANSSSFLNDSITCNGSDVEDLNKVEEYIPDFVPGSSTGTSNMGTVPVYKPEKNSEINEVQSEYEPESVASVMHSTPTYNPEKNIAQIEMNQIKSEYSPAPLNTSEKSLEEIVYKPMTKTNKSSETEKRKRKCDRKNVSKELFGTSDDDSDVDSLDQMVSSSSRKSKRKKETSSFQREEKSDKESTKSKKKKSNNRPMSRISATSDGDIRNLMDDSVESILATYPDHETHLTELYEKNVRNLVSSITR